MAEVAGQKDQVFKELLREFFPDFVRLFYPQIAAQLDWSTLRFLDKETSGSAATQSSTTGSGGERGGAEFASLGK
jgi:hypothetical protein